MIPSKPLLIAYYIISNEMQESTVHHLRLVTIKRQNQLTYLSHFVVNDTRTNYRRNEKQQLDTIQL